MRQRKIVVIDFAVNDGSTTRTAITTAALVFYCMSCRQQSIQQIIAYRQLKTAVVRGDGDVGAAAFVSSNNAVGNHFHGDVGGLQFKITQVVGIHLGINLPNEVGADLHFLWCDLDVVR